MRRIHYEYTVPGGYTCVTPCPYNITTEGGRTFLVGTSCYCERCKYFVAKYRNSDSNKQFVVCKADEELDEKN